MSNQLLASKIVVQEEAPTLRGIPALDTAVLGAVGICEKGPINVATLVQSFSQFVETFGGYIAGSDMCAAVEGYFENGGTNIWIVRIVHYTDITDRSTNTSDPASRMLLTAAIAATAGYVVSGNTETFDLEPGQTLLVKIDGGGVQTTTFLATAASRTSANELYALANNDTLTVRIDGGSVQTITFLTSEFADITNATAQEVVNVLNASLVGASASVAAGPAVKITSDRRGTGSGVNVTGGTGNAALGFTTGNIAGTGNVSNIDAVTAAEVVAALVVVGATASVLSGAVKITSATTGGGSSVQVTSGSTATAVGFDNAIHTGDTAGTLDTLLSEGKYDGTYGNDLSVKISAATSGEAARFNLDVLDSSGLQLETFPNLSMTDTDPRYVETVINAVHGSSRIKVTDQDAATPAPNDRPANGTYAMSGGDDGLVGLADADYVGSSASDTGLRALDLVDDLTLLIVPGIATSGVHNAMITYCEVTRGGQVFAVLDCPADQTASDIITYVESTAGIAGLTEYAAIYWPRIQVLNPNKTVFGKDDTIVVPPSGHIAGMYARNDSAKQFGVFTTPAGTEEGKLFGCVGFETDSVLKEEVRDLVFPKRINPITTMKGFPRYVDGARTLKGDGNFPTVAQRRGVSFTERSIKLGLQFARHKNNTPELRAVLDRTCFAFLKSETDAGCFASKDPKTAFFVDFGDALNPATQPNIVTGRIGLATAQPAEFIVLKFSQDTRAIDQALAG